MSSVKKNKKSQTERKSLQKAYLVKDCYPKYIKQNSAIKKKNNLIMDQRPLKQTSHQRRNKHMKKILHIICHQGNAN